LLRGHLRTLLAITPALAAALLLAACGGGVGVTANAPPVAGSVIGLLAGNSVQLQDNGGDTLTVFGNGGFRFATQLANGSSYAVTVLAQPTNENCVVKDGTGIVGTSNLINVIVTCSPDSYSISGTVSGLLSGRSVVLEDNGGNATTLGANGAFTFTTPVASGSNYAVTVATQPGGQTCAITNGSGTVGDSNVDDVSVDCSGNTYNVIANVSGITIGGLVLQDDGGNNLSISANGSFDFKTPLASGSAYAVTVLTQATGETCVVTNGSGVIAAANVNATIVCTPNKYSIGGTVSGLLAGNSVVVQDNGGNSTTLTANGGFTFSTTLASGSNYAVTVLTSPAGQTCAVSNGSGAVVAANVTNVAVVCGDKSYNIAATVSGLVQTGLSLQDNGGDNLSIPTNGTYNFNTPLASGSTYSVTILSQPAGGHCEVINGSGKVGSANVDVVVTCGTLSYTVGGTVSGLVAGTNVVLQDNGANTTTVLASSPTFTFPALPSGAAYSVTVLSQSPGETCAVAANGSGTVGAANITNVVVTCTPMMYTIGGTVTGLVAGTQVVLQDNLTNNTTVLAASPSFTFSVALPSGAAYSVTVLSQSPGETCAVAANGSGTVGAANITNVVVTCTPMMYTIGGTVTGLLTGNSVTLQDNGLTTPGNEVTVTGTGASPLPFTFGAPVAYGSPYAVTVLTQPVAQVCAVNFGSGIVTPPGNVTTVAVICRGWIWESGPNAINQYGTYGAQPPSVGVPGGRQNAVSWTDSSGNLWLFGGLGLDGNPADPAGYLNDLWEYSTTTGQWTWISGSSTTYAFGDYGQQGVPETYNVPGARVFASSWIDSAGNFWLFGGSGVDADGNIGDLNDLWEFTPPNGPWVWQSGSAVANQEGVYGSLGTGAPGNVPGSRVYGLSWTDTSGNLWLFGGYGEDSTYAAGDLNDMWEYIPPSGPWVWQSGSSIANQLGGYVAKGTPSLTNAPGARDGAVAWKDATGNFWLFGGYGPAFNAANGDFNDLWEFSPTTLQWTWVSGSATTNQGGVYGTPGILSAANVPGARDDATAWADSSGNLWLFGGSGYYSNVAFGSLNDLWLFNPSPTPGAWIYIGGSLTVDAPGTYGTAAPSAGLPGARLGASGWTDGNDNFWLFGGFGFDGAGDEGFLNDLWTYTPQ
jgi:ribosomal protein S11